MNRSETIADFVETIRHSRKYRHLDIPASTLSDIISTELDRSPSTEHAVNKAREVLHGVMAPYLGDPDYTELSAHLDRLAKKPDADGMCALSLDVLRSHASTSERIPHLENFYAAIWEITGHPTSVQDLACALHPFGLPWMGLASAATYLAYDIHSPRVAALNKFFALLPGEKSAWTQDILVETPERHTDVALFFKEAHRFEQRRRGCLPEFFRRIQADWLVVSLPANDLHGHHSLVDRHRALITRSAQLKWPMHEIQVGNELIFILDKRG